MAVYTAVFPLQNLYTPCLKKVIFKLSVTLSHLNRFSKFLHCWKRMKFATKPIWHRPPHLRHVATIPWEIKNSNFCRCLADMEENRSIVHLPLTLLFVQKFWHFRFSKMGCLSPYSLQIIMVFLCHSRCHCSVCQWSTWYSATVTGEPATYAATVFGNNHERQRWKTFTFLLITTTSKQTTISWLQGSVGTVTVCSEISQPT